ncbi:hypothetical protein [Winogradskyella sp.]|uniref:hypothetical protein n=1 Tax=Winogradskyella sp. TaxID=1883156 RepID=UPI003F6A6432
MKRIIALIFVIGLTSSIEAQDVTPKESRNKIVYNEYKKLVESGEFIFTANWVMSDNKREMTDAETNKVSFKKDQISGQLKVLSNTNNNIKLNEKGNYGVFYSDESELIMVVFTTENALSISNIKLEIKNGKVFLRLDGKELSDTTWIGQLTEL